MIPKRVGNKLVEYLHQCLSLGSRICICECICIRISVSAQTFGVGK